jgi:uncharacterized protein YqjF (DUF2071 family)
MERVERPVILQNWRQLTFLHWRYPADVLQARVPKGLEIETFDGSAWLAIVPFYLCGLRRPRVPALPWISGFAETNLRTYVRGPDGKSAVWFFSLDAERLAAVAGARLTYGLPYMWSRMRLAASGSRVLYQSARRWPDRLGRTEIEIERGKSLEADPLEEFLTARFGLYSVLRGRLAYAPVEHPPWPLESARAVRLSETLTETAGLPKPDGPPLAHFSPGVDVRTGAAKVLTCL